MTAGKARLIDIGHEKLIASAFCFRKDDTVKNPPTHGQLLADQGALLKRRLHDHAAQCALELEHKIVGSGLRPS